MAGISLTSAAFFSAFLAFAASVGWQRERAGPGRSGSSARSSCSLAGLRLPVRATARPGPVTRRCDPYREPVPRISAFYGIAIYMHWNEAHHARPHFHARYAGQAASVDLNGDVIAGSLPRRALALVAEWARQHHDELEANWERARSEESLEPIDPLP